MQFKHPELLWALFLLIIPIIVHLFQLRRFEKVWFTNVAFLKEIQLQTRKSSTLKKWLTLITRLCIFTFLILAFAQPYFPTKNSIAKEQETVIYVDNSFSMQAKGSKGPLMQRALQDIIANTTNEDQFTIFTNNENYVNTTLPPIQNKLVTTSYSSHQLSYNEAYLKGAAYFSDKAENQKNFIYISDFQQKNTSFSIDENANIQTHFVQVVPENTLNISVDTLYISKKEANTIELTAELSANKMVENATVSLFNKDAIEAKTATSITPENKAKVYFTIPEHTTFEGAITIKDEALQYDNQCFFSIQQPEKINVLTISNTEDTFLKKIYTDEAFKYTSQTIDAIDFTKINEQHIIILNEIDNISTGLSNALQAFVSNGGSIALIPSEDGNSKSYNQLLHTSGITFGSIRSSEQNITAIHFSHPLFQNVFQKSVTNFQYPKVNSYYQLNGNSAALSLADGNPLLATAPNTYVFSAPLHRENSNFQNSPLVVPTFYNIAQNSLQLPTLYYTIGKPQRIDINATIGNDAVVEIANANSKFIPMQESFPNKVRIHTNELPTTAGNYQIQYQEKDIQTISYNYDREESNLHYYNLADYNISVTNDLSSLFDDLKSQSQDSGLWKWFVIFALLFLCVEMFILKFLK